MPVPYEVVFTHDITAYVAPTGEAFPAVNATPAGNWSRIGTSGNLNYVDSGLTVMHQQSFTKWRALGDTGTRKVNRTEESLTIKFTLADITLEQYRYSLNGNSVTTVAAGGGAAGYKKIGLSRGLTVAQYALLVRSKHSAYGDGWNSQYEVPYAFQVGEPELIFQKTQPVGLELVWEAVIDPNAATAVERFGRLVMQHADPA